MPARGAGYGNDWPGVSTEQSSYRVENETRVSDTFEIPAQGKFFIAGEEVSECVYRSVVLRAEVRPILEYFAYQETGMMAKAAQDILDQWRDENLEPRT